jgi:hypothetical protein
MYFIGNFHHLTDQQANDETQRRHGTFSMMVSANAIDDALDNFRLRLINFKKTSDFFGGRCTIYLSQMLEFDQIPQKEAVLLNFKSFAGDPGMPYIACVVPTEQSNACKIHEWQANQPLTEGRQDSVFIQFD